MMLRLCFGLGRSHCSEEAGKGTSLHFSCSVVSNSATPWTAACQVSQSFTNSWSLFKLMSIESMMPFNHLILCHPLFLLPSSFPASGSYLHIEASVQSSSVTQSYPTLCNPMNCSTAGLPVHHQLLEFTQTHVHQVSDAIQPCHPLSSSSPPAPSSSQHQGLLQ